MTREEKKAAKLEAAELAKEDKKNLKQWNEFVNRMELKGALREPDPVRPDKQLAMFKTGIESVPY